MQRKLGTQFLFRSFPLPILALFYAQCQGYHLQYDLHGFPRGRSWGPDCLAEVPNHPQHGGGVGSGFGKPGILRLCWAFKVRKGMLQTVTV